jgi:hypothetical protein
MNECQKSGIWRDSMRLSGRAQLRYDLASVCNQYLFAPPDTSEVFAEAILELANANHTHGKNVASCSYMVNDTVGFSSVITGTRSSLLCAMSIRSKGPVPA